jgi:hypothetical protein
VQRKRIDLNHCSEALLDRASRGSPLQVMAAIQT